MLPKSSFTCIARACLAIGALVSVLSGSAANGSPPDRLSADKLECVMAAYRNKRDDWYGGFAVNARTGLLTVSRRNHVDVWGECAAGPLQSLPVETGVADKTQLSTNARYLLASRYMGSPVEIFDLSGARQPIRLPNCRAQAVLSPFEDVAVVQCSEGVRLVDLTSGAFVGTALELQPTAFSMATNTRFDRLVVGTASGTLALIAIEKIDKGYSLNIMKTWDTGYGTGEWITPVAFSADERQIISVGRSGQLDVWDANNGASLRHWQADLRWVGTATFARDQRYVALFGQKAGSGAQNRVEIIEVATGRRMVSGTPYNYQYAVYIESLDRLLVAGPNTPPYLLDLPPDRRESTGGAAQGVCANSASGNCLRVALEGADQQLNVVFGRLIASATPAKAKQLRDAQRAWLQERNRRCALRPGSTASEDWLATLAKDEIKANCVYDTTMTRLRELRTQPTANLADETVEKQEYTFPASRNSGKLYAEVSLYVKDADQGPVTTIVQIGVTDAKAFVGTQVDTAKVASKALPNGDYVIGLAIDLDNGKLYVAENGQWRTAPGSLEGSELRRGQHHSIAVNTPGRLLSSFLRLGAVRINTGNQPFQFATPAGYRPYYQSPNNLAGGSRLESIVPIYLKVANRSLSQWADRYWAWLLVKSPERNPVTDTTGAHCADAQAGPVWFLAGADAASNIVRSCTIPRGKHLLLPVIASLIRSSAGSKPCAKLEADDVPATGAANIKSVYVSIDGQRFDSLYDHRVHTKRCWTVRGDAGETVVSDVVYFGAWVLLQPLPPGNHLISFGGQLEDLQMNRDVTYELRVE